MAEETKAGKAGKMKAVFTKVKDYTPSTGKQWVGTAAIAATSVVAVVGGKKLAGKIKSRKKK